MKHNARRVLCALASCLMIHSAASAEETVTITTAPAEHPAKISPALLGTQFNYFSPPVRAKLTNAAVQESWRTLPVKALRYPGGTWADHYLWDNPAQSYYVVGDAKQIVRPDQFVQLCREIGAEPIFQVNVSSKGHDILNRLNPTKPADIDAAAKNAAGWVRQANKEKGWNVKYWEIGNEVWIWLKPEENAKIVAAYAKAMKAVDPSIKIIACGLSSNVGPFDSSWFKIKDDPTWTPRTAVNNEADAWNAALSALPAGTFDYIAPHPYMSAKEDVPPDQVYLNTEAKVDAATALRSQQELARSSQGKFRLAVTEWTTNFNRSVPVKRDFKPNLYYYSLANGLNIAHYFGRILEGADVTDIAIHHSIEDSQTMYYWPKKELSPGQPLDHPSALGMRLWGKHLGTVLDQTTLADVPKIDAGDTKLAAVQAWGSSSNTKAYLVVLNLDPTAAHTIRWNGPNKTGASVEATWMKGDSLTSQNFGAWDNRDAAEVKLTTETLKAAAEGLSVTLPPHSMLGLTVGK